MNDFSLTTTTKVTIELSEEYARKLAQALSSVMAAAENNAARSGAGPPFVELVNKGHIDTLCVVKNAIQLELP